MKKITILTVLFSSIYAVSHAQLSKIPSQPIYDNAKQEHLIKHVNTPKHMEKYALMDNSPVHNNKWPANRIALIGNTKNDKSLFKIDASGYSPNSNPYDIKNVTFPKTNYLLN